MRDKYTASILFACLFVLEPAFAEETTNKVEYSCKNHFINEIEQMLDVTDRLWQEKGMKFTLKCRHTQNNEDEFIRSYQDELEFTVETPGQE